MASFGGGGSANSLTPKLMVNPLIVLNMGGEMIYILQQRLRAQNISKDKSSRVLLETVTALFDLQMVDTLFTQQPTFHSSAVRELFHQITHSSIMRLNDQSMDKLYDLMLMGLKVQIVRCRDCYELIESTLTHIDGVRDIVESKCVLATTTTTTADAEQQQQQQQAHDVMSTIDGVRARLIRTYCTQLSVSKLFAVRKHLFQWLQDRKIKVSILLQQSLQSLDGHIVNHTNGILPIGAEIPGKQYHIIVKNDGAEKIVTSDESDLILSNAKCCYPNTIAYTFKYGELHTDIGRNLYTPNDGKKKSRRGVGGGIGGGGGNANMTKLYRGSPRKEIGHALKNELNDLSSMINDKNSNNSVQKRKGLMQKDDLFKTGLFDFDIAFDTDKESCSAQRFGRATSVLEDALHKLDLDVDDKGNDLQTVQAADDDLFSLLNQEQ